MGRDSGVESAVARGVRRLQRVADVVLQLAGGQQVGHECGRELAGRSAGAGRAAACVGSC